MIPSLYLIANTLDPVTIGCLYTESDGKKGLIMSSLTVFVVRHQRRYPLDHYMASGE
jgi:hypothetical protein